MGEYVDTTKGTPEEEAKKIIKIFSEMEEMKQDVKDINTSLKEMLELFCEQNDNYSPKQIKTGYKFFVKHQKNKQALTLDELERDKMIEIIENSI